ncbi:MULTISPECIES: hypothetical protein [Mammaliicoccus]|uniref:Uncharacterized protein n=1 Tax=Mammaliicoccus sciuri TaxID=1296 RepID=A0AAW5LK64_MAMSC|nr:MULTISPECIES: hypothetical protein [Mammaliicoccus]MCJ1780387.1 hypothetical protein [Mammaliicoccus sciuri]MCQ9303050.1 hypothetical protein [Mammaliicoccus sciuri]PTK27527.1 hypothetical protein BUZ86_05460 [Mammaliicoccus sciuri]RIO10728.1 hypothetical protein BUZ96_08045 [Mammaliicoccus sciuri]
MPQEKISYEFGMADFIFDEGLPTETRFDGKMCEDGSLLQGDGGEVQLEPELEDINSPDFGNTNYDQVVVGWNGTVTIVAMKATLDLISKTLSGTISLEADGKVVSVTDAPIGASLREGARTLRIHPRQMGDDTSEDIFIHKIANSSGMTKSFANEQGNYEMEFAMFPKDCADANKPNNYFYIGQDPDELVEGAEEVPAG